MKESNLAFVSFMGHKFVGIGRTHCFSYQALRTPCNIRKGNDSMRTTKTLHKCAEDRCSRSSSFYQL